MYHRLLYHYLAKRAGSFVIVAVGGGWKWLSLAGLSWAIGVLAAWVSGGSGWGGSFPHTS